MRFTEHWLARYTLALIAVVAAFSLRQGLVRLIGAELPPYITFYPTVMLVALAAGFGPGLLATVTAALLTDYRLLPPIGAFGIDSIADLLGISLFIGMGVFMSGVAEFYRPSRQKGAIREQESAEGFTGDAPSLSSRHDLLIIAGFVLSIAILTALGGLSFRYMAAEAEADRWFNHTHVVIGDLDRFVSAMKDVETGQRGFVITGDEKFLGPYKAALGDVESRMAELKRLTADNPRQQRRLAEIAPLVGDKLDYSRNQIELRKTLGFQAARDVMAEAKGKALMDEIRQRAAEARAEEEQLLRQRSDAKRSSGNSVLQAIGFGYTLSILLLGSVFFFLKRENARRLLAEKDLRRQRDRLEDQVAERTADLGRNNEQLITEIDERKQTEEKLREARDYLENLFNYANAPVIVWDSSFRVTRFNHAFERLTGLKAHEVIGKTLDILFPDKSMDESMGLIQNALSGERWETVEIPILHIGGSVRTFLWNLANIHDRDNKKVVATIAQGQDITERKQAEEAITASLHEKEVLLKEVHHRVKNNLQVISSLVSLQADGSTDETVREVLRDVTYRVRSMALVHEKLYQSTDLAHIDFAEYSRSLLGYLWRAHGSAAASIRLNLALSPVELPVDTAVPCGLILNELAGNALKHAFRGRDEGDVIVSLQSGAGGRITLSVADNGVGLPAGLDWRQAKSLGLRLVQMLSSQIGASVEMSTGEGTRFEIVLGLIG